MTNLLDLFRYSLRSLSHRRLRSYLTVLGIVIGVASVITLISIGDGLMAGVEEQLEAFGPRNAIIMPGEISTMAMSGGGYKPPSEGRLFEKDFEKVRSSAGVTYPARQISTRLGLEYKKENITVTINGIEPEPFRELVDIDVTKGRFLSDADRSVAIIGWSFSDDSVFRKDPMMVGSVFYLGEQRKRFKVVGILDPSNRISKSLIIIPFEDAKNLASESLADNELSMIRFQVADGYDVTQTIDSIVWSLASSRGKTVEDKDFSVITADFILGQVGQIIGVLTAFLGFITGVSLLVGGVGVANTTYMSVLEKTKEIGTLKAIGATSRDILSLIVIESALIGLAGGIIGLLVGFVISLIAGLFDFKTVITIWLAGFALIFSISIGVISGLFPAMKAAKLSPIAAIRQN